MQIGPPPCSRKKFIRLFTRAGHSLRSWSERMRSRISSRVPITADRFRYRVVHQHPTDSTGILHQHPPPTFNTLQHAHCFMQIPITFIMSHHVTFASMISELFFYSSNSSLLVCAWDSQFESTENIAGASEVAPFEVNNHPHSHPGIKWLKFANNACSIAAWECSMALHVRTSEGFADVRRSMYKALHWHFIIYLSLIVSPLAVSDLLNGKHPKHQNVQIPTKSELNKRSLANSHWSSS